MKKNIVFLMTLILVITLIGCSTNATETSADTPAVSSQAAEPKNEASSESPQPAETPVEKKKLSFAVHNAKESTNAQAITELAKYANENSDTIEIEVFYNAELGDVVEVIEGVAIGTIDMTIANFAQLSALYGDMEVFSMPYLVKNSVDNKKLLDINSNPVLQEIVAGFEANSTVTLFSAHASGEARQLTASFPVYSPADLAGQKIRSINNDVYTVTVEGMGAVPVPIAFSELPSALSTGTVVGQENPYSTLVSYSMWDVQDYVMETNHMYENSGCIINTERWNSLSEDDRKVLTDAGIVGGNFWYNLQYDNQEEFRQQCIDNGMTIITPENGLDFDAFKASVDAKKNEKYAKYSDYFTRIGEYLGY